MNFNSPLFLLFIAVVITINYFLAQRFRARFLLSASLLFIASYNVDSLVAILLLSFFNFHIAKIIANNRLLFITAILINSMAILLFNYLSTSQGGISFYFAGIVFEINSVIVAIGLSFYTLQNIAYLTDIYFKRSVCETSFSNYLMYAAFFPKILSGPVMLPNEFLPQIKTNAITNEKLISGFNRFVIGLLKKMVIADRLSPTVHSIFDYDDNYHGFTTLIGIYVFTVQLYFDFSGYTDMALGVGKMLGYELKENFNLPFRSKSVSEFWRRWHISLISWLTTYIYYPLVYHLRIYKKFAVLLGIALIFFTSSIWRGISYPFLAWAVCHVSFISFEFLTKSKRMYLSERFNNWIYKGIAAFIVFNAICFSNVFFRSHSMDKAFQLISNVFTNFVPQDWLLEFVAPLAIGGHQVEQFNIIISWLIPLVFILFERKINHLAISNRFNSTYVIICILLIMIFGIFDSGSRFIYMQY